MPNELPILKTIMCSLATLLFDNTIAIMNPNKPVDEKVKELSTIIFDLEKKIADEEMNFNDVDTIKDKILDLKRKLGIYKELLHNYSSPAVDFRNMC